MNYPGEDGLRKSRLALRKDGDPAWQWLTPEPRRLDRYETGTRVHWKGQEALIVRKSEARKPPGMHPDDWAKRPDAGVRKYWLRLPDGCLELAAEYEIALLGETSAV